MASDRPNVVKVRVQIFIDVNSFTGRSTRVTSDAPDIPERVLHFISKHIDSVPQLEALLLLWQEPHKAWSVDEIASRVYVSRELGQQILRSLQSRQLAMQDDGDVYRYSAAWDASGTLMAEVVSTYRRHLVPIATFIHSRGSASVRDFARAFDLKKDR